MTQTFEEYLSRKRIDEMFCHICRENKATHSDVKGDLYCKDCLRKEYKENKK